MVETNTFREPAVAELLKKNFVESRMHLEHYRETGGKAEELFNEFQQKFAKSQAMPTFVVLDPDDLTEIHWHQITGMNPPWVAEFKAFFEQAIRESKKPGSH